MFFSFKVIIISSSQVNFIVISIMSNSYGMRYEKNQYDMHFIAMQKVTMNNNLIG